MSIEGFIYSRLWAGDLAYHNLINLRDNPIAITSAALSTAASETTLSLRGSQFCGWTVLSWAVLAWDLLCGRCEMAAGVGVIRILTWAGHHDGFCTRTTAFRLERQDSWD